MSAVERLDEIAARREHLDWPKTDDVRTLVSALRAVLALHQPRPSTSAWDLVGWTTCSCGAMDVSCRIDGSPSLAPAEYPCPTVRAITAALDVSP